MVFTKLIYPIFSNLSDSINKKWVSAIYKDPFMFTVLLSYSTYRVI